METQFIFQIIFTIINISIATAFVIASFRYRCLRKFLLEISDRCYDKIKEYHNKRSEALKRKDYDEFEVLSKGYNKTLSAWNKVIISVYTINGFSVLTSLMKPIKYESWFPEDVVEALKEMDEEIKCNKITKS